MSVSRSVRAVGVFFLALGSAITALALARSSGLATETKRLLVAEKRGVLVVDETTVQPILEISSGGEARAVAVDSRRDSVWQIAKTDLLKFRTDGTLLSTIPVPTVADDGSGSNRVGLEVDSGDGSIWLGYKKRLLHVAADGRLLLSMELDEALQGLALDSRSARLAIVTPSRLLGISTPDGAPVFDIPANHGDDFRDVSVGSASFWAVTRQHLRRYDAAGALLSEASCLDAERIASDPQGGAWLTTATRLARVSTDLQVGPQIAPFANPNEKLVALAVDAFGTWVAAATEVRLFDRSGAFVRSLTLSNQQKVADLAVAVGDVTLPVISIVRPATGSVLPTGRPEIVVEWSDDESAVEVATFELEVDGNALEMTCTEDASGRTCLPNFALADGTYSLVAKVSDEAGNEGTSDPVSFRVDTTRPTVSIITPAEGALTRLESITISGALSESASVRINGVPASTGPDLSFSGTAILSEGTNTVLVEATDEAGNQGSASIHVVRDSVPPAPIDLSRVTLSPGASTISVVGTAGSAEPNGSVVAVNLRTSASAVNSVDSIGGFSLVVGGVAGDTLSLTARDGAGNLGPAQTMLVPDATPPSLPGPAVDPTVATDFGDSTEFIYEGPNPVQTGVAPGTIEKMRAAVIRGSVLDTGGSALPGVAVSIAGHTELGSTVSRSDGNFDLVVNGGGKLVVRWTKPGYLPVDRTIEVPWREFTFAPTVAMTPLDAAVSTVTTGAAVTQIARGMPVADASGPRQTTLLFPPGVTAAMELSDGSSVSLSTLHVRATEYTVGPNGPKAMPAALPETSGYTWCAELSVDEALSAGARSVRFDRPIPILHENFLHLPVGTPVPVGWYDRVSHQWIPAPNGRVIGVVGFSGGLAELDVDGTGAPADSARLAALGISDAERESMATLYPVGTSLWRSALDHFTPVDHNFPLVPKPGSRPPGQRPPHGRSLEDRACEYPGSTIECENQVLGETIDLVGIPFSLHYRSDRVVGRASARVVEIPLSDASLPPNLLRIELECDVAGNRQTWTYPPSPNLSHSYFWDGRDAYGRFVQGRQKLRVRVGYTFPAEYGGPASAPASFGLPPGSPTPSQDFERLEVTYWQESSLEIGAFLAQSFGLGGWTIGPNHLFDHGSGLLVMGDGRRRSTPAFGNSLRTAAGDGIEASVPSEGDGGPASAARLGSPENIAVGPDGSIYVADRTMHQIRRISPSGIISTFAGTGVRGFSGDGGPAALAQIGNPRGLAFGPDGSLFVADWWNDRVRRISPSGIITTVAGGGASGSGADNRPAVGAYLYAVVDVALAGDGTLYISHGSRNMVSRVSPDGMIYRYAGTGTRGFSGDGGPARNATLAYVWGLAVGPDGSLYIADNNNNRIRRVGIDGVIQTVIGNGTQLAVEGVPGLQTGLSMPLGLAVDRDGAVYYADQINMLIRRMGSDGLVRTIAGDGTWTNFVDGGSATGSSIDWATDVAVGEDGTVYEPSWPYRRVLAIRPSMPGFAPKSYQIPSEDGGAVYVFDAAGRHVETRESILGSTLALFGYDSSGRIESVRDGDGNTVTFDRSTSGRVVIRSPFGQETTLTLDGNGYLASVSNPVGEQVRVAHRADGLLDSITDARGNTSIMGWDGLGNLVRDEDPLEGASVLTRTDRTDGYTVTITDAAGRATRHEIDRLPDGGQRRRVTTPGGQVSTTDTLTSGKSTLIRADGTKIEETLGPDPRFGMLAPIVAQQTITFPSGLSRVTTTTRTAELANPADPLSLAKETTSVTVAGNTSTTVLDTATRSVTLSSPEARTSTLRFDDRARLVSEEVPGLHPAGYGYDSLGRLQSVTTGTRTTSVGYDSRGFLSGVDGPAALSASFSIAPSGRLDSLTLPGGRTVGLSSDRNGNLLSLTPPSKPAHTFTWTKTNLLESYTAPDVGPGVGRTTSYGYNAARELTRVEKVDGLVIGYGHDPAGRLESVSAPDGSLSFTYDPTTGKPTTATSSDATVTSAFDGSLPTESTISGAVAGSVSKTYDSQLRLASTTIAGASFPYDYDRDGILTAVGPMALSRDPISGLLSSTSAGVVNDTWTFTPYGEIDVYEARAGATVLYRADHDYDDAGRLIRKAETIGGATGIWEYGYDSASRLSWTKRNGSLLDSWSYDGNGNRQDTTGTAVYDAQDRLLQHGTTDFTYAPTGELLTRTQNGATVHYTHDSLGQLRTVLLDSGVRIDYLYDARGRRIAKKVGGNVVKRWLYDGQLRVVAELDGAGSVTARFVYGTRLNVPDLVVTPTASYRVIADRIGSPRLIVDMASGVVAQRMDFGPWGEVTLDSNDGFQPFGFAGGAWDSQTRMVHFGAREYDPGLGRWVEKDPLGFVGGDANLYAYVANDPVQFADPSGMAPSDRRYGLPPKFWDWWHGEKQKQGNPPDLTKEEAEELHEQWEGEGKPSRDKKGKHRGGGRGRNGGKEPECGGEEQEGSENDFAELGFCDRHPVMCGLGVGILATAIFVDPIPGDEVLIPALVAVLP